MKETVKNAIFKMKKRYEPEGFIILGIFGSYAREDEQPGSDLDILYELSDIFYQRYDGWEAIGRIDDIKNEIKNEIHIEIDLANRKALSEIAKKYILPEVIYVT